MTLDPVLGGERLAHVLLEPGQADELDVGVRLVGLEVPLARPADADHGDPQRAHANHPRGDSGLAGTGCRNCGAAQRTALASTRWIAGWWYTG